MLLAEKVEIWKSTEESAASNSELDYLGYVTLSDNVRTMYKSRELKSVPLPLTEASSLMLKLHQPHSNAHNLHHQVSISIKLISFVYE